MTIDHIAIWTRRPEEIRDFYTHFFGGISGDVYVNEKKEFRSYFVTFGDGARLEIMCVPQITEPGGDPAFRKGIVHIAFGAGSVAEVDEKAREMQTAGYPILSGPRRTSDGYYEFAFADPDGNLLEVTTRLA